MRLTPFARNFSIPLLYANDLWEPHPTTHRWTVSYTLANGALLRDVQPQGGAAFQSLLAEQVTALNCTLIDDAASQPIAARLALETGTGTLRRKVVTEFLLHLPRQVVP